jgi:hypothetical protein
MIGSRKWLCYLSFDTKMTQMICDQSFESFEVIWITSQHWQLLVLTTWTIVSLHHLAFRHVCDNFKYPIYTLTIIDFICLVFTYQDWLHLHGCLSEPLYKIFFLNFNYIKDPTSRITFYCIIKISLSILSLDKFFRYEFEIIFVKQDGGSEIAVRINGLHHLISPVERSNILMKF